MNKSITTPDSLQPATELAVDLFDNWFDPIETEVRARSRQFIEERIRSELDAALARPCYGRSRMAGNEAKAGVTGHRHGSRTRSLTGTFGPIEIAVPRARLDDAEGKTTEWKSGALRAYQRRTLAADALIAGSYLAGTNTRRVRRALAGRQAARVRWEQRQIRKALQTVHREQAKEGRLKSVTASIRGIWRMPRECRGQTRPGLWPHRER